MSDKELMAKLAKYGLDEHPEPCEIAGNDEELRSMMAELRAWEK